MKTQIILVVAMIFLIIGANIAERKFLSRAYAFEVYINGVKMVDVKNVRIVTPDKHELIFVAPIPIPVTNTAIPRARRWYGPAGPGHFDPQSGLYGPVPPQWLPPK